jgi:3'(2'), 5'-bisphosphate nucleotidase
MSASREQLLEVARRAALAAGEAILEVYATAFDVRLKTDNTPVCEADLASERIIVSMLSEAFPDIPIASEEMVEAEGLPPSAARFWVVDPLDGTKEFVARNDEFAVLIALVEYGVPVLGVVHGPAVGITYAACGPGTATRQCNGGPPGPIRAPRAVPGAHPAAGRARRDPQPLA